MYIYYTYMYTYIYLPTYLPTYIIFYYALSAMRPHPAAGAGAARLTRAWPNAIGSKAHPNRGLDWTVG